MGYAECIIIGKLEYKDGGWIQKSAHYASDEGVFLTWRELDDKGFPSVRSSRKDGELDVLYNDEPNVVSETARGLLYKNTYLAKAETTIFCLVLPPLHLPRLSRSITEIFDTSKSEMYLLLVWVSGRGESSRIDIEFVFRHESEARFQEFSLIKFRKKMKLKKRLIQMLDNMIGEFPRFHIGR